MNIEMCNDACEEHFCCPMFAELSDEWPCPYQFDADLIKLIEENIED